MVSSRVWIITGASRGLGLALAREVARRGETLVICARGEKELARAAVELRSVGATAREGDGGAGAVGAAGATGAAGAAGDVGDVGPAGAFGAAGVVEAVGREGPAGSVGRAAPFEPTGPAAPVGPVGPVGPVAPVGPVEPAAPTVHAIVGDVADRDFGRRLVEEALQRFGRVDVLVNNASLLGPSPLPPLRDYPLDQLEQVFAANVVGPLNLVQWVLPSMLDRGLGLIVNISSDAAVGGYPGWGGYGASKAALDLITHTLANELAGTGVSAIAIDPGDMRTQMHQAAFPGEDISDRPLPEEVVPGILQIIDGEYARANGSPKSWRYEAQRFFAQDFHVRAGERS